MMMMIGAAASSSERKWEWQYNDSRTCLLTLSEPVLWTTTPPVSAKMWRWLVALSACMCVCVSVSGAPHKTSYDQRQQGELNIHAQLDNIVVVFIPTSNIQLMELGLKKHQKPQGFLQLLQKLKDDMATVNNEITASQEVVQQSHEEKEEEVVATVEEMKPEKISSETPKEETTESTTPSDHPTVSESVQESVMVVSVPEELRDAVKLAEEEVKPTLPDKKSDTELYKFEDSDPAKNDPVKDETNLDQIVRDVPKKEVILEALLKPTAGADKLESPSEDKMKNSDEVSKPPKFEIVLEAVLHEAPKKPLDVVNVSKPVVEEPKKKVDEPVKKPSEESGDSVLKRKDKVIKWAGLVDLMGPVGQRSRDPQVQRMASLCHPGVWDVELQTCLTPGSRKR